MKRSALKRLLIISLIQAKALLSPPSLAGTNDLKDKVSSHIIKSTVMIQAVGIDPGSGVILKKESDRYLVITAAHVLGRSVCAYPEDADEIDIMTHDGKYYSADPASIKCPPALSRQHLKYFDELCPSRLTESTPWPIDLALLEFSTDNSYSVASKHTSVKRNGVHIYVGGYPQNQSSIIPQPLIIKSNGPANLPPSNPKDTCKGYGLRYVMPTRVGMSGGGIWSSKGKLIGIHGWREQTGGQSIAIEKGSASAGIPLSYWKQQKDPYSLRFELLLSDNDSIDDSDKIDVPALISKARALVNLSQTQDRETFILKSDDILYLLKKAEQADLQQAVIPTLIAQIYIRKYNQEASNPGFLELALQNINKAVKLARHWSGSYDAKFEKVRAHIHFLRNKPKKAIIDIDTRLRKVPDDVSSLKDRAKYSFAVSDYQSAYDALIKAKEYAPNDLSVDLDIATVFGRIGSETYLRRACKLLEHVLPRITKKEESSRGALKLDLHNLRNRANNLIRYFKC